MNRSPEIAGTAVDDVSLLHQASVPGAVAVVGMGLALPGANDPVEFWRLLNQDEHAFGEPELFSLQRWYSPDEQAADKTYIRAAGFMRNFVPHGQLGHELDQGRWIRADLTTVLLRHCLLQAITGIVVRDSDRVGCYIGALSSSVALEEAILIAAAIDTSETSEDAERLAATLSSHYRHAVRVPRDAFADRMIRAASEGLLPISCEWLAVDTACSSSLYAIDLGVKSLLAGEREVALCGSSNIGARRDLVLFAKLKGLSTNGQVRAFDSHASGVLFSDAAGIVALKTLDRARADGDEILGLLGGFGGSVDGRGSVLAPDAEGQQLAVQRARRVNGVVPTEVPWIVGHGTGTPIGDATELESLAALAGAGRHVVTSNKPLVGHGGWAAGVVSVIHALLALKHGRIPRERYFTSLPEGIAADAITIPLTDVPFDVRPGGRRTVAVCAYGLGGTNAHLLLHGPEPAGTPPPCAGYAPRIDDPVVLVGWHTHLPGGPGRDAVLAWLAGTGHGPPRTFGEPYPRPASSSLRMPPLTARSIDRTHLMAVDVAAAFAETHGELWQAYRETTGVITGHMGPTSSMIDYTVRAGADDLLAAVAAHPDVRPTEIARLRADLDRLRDRRPSANADSMPGQLPNIISCRVANRFGFRGVSLAVDAGRSSSQAALHLASRYLGTGELDMALVLGINGNSSPVMARLCARPPDSLAEGVVLMVLTRRSLASRNGWPELATIRTEATPSSVRAAHVPHPPIPEIGWGDRDGDVSYQGADGALALLRAVYSGVPEVAVSNADEGPRIVVRPSGRFESGAHGAGGDRSVLAMRRRDAVAVRERMPPIRRSTLILVDSAPVAEALGARAIAMGARIVSTDPATAAAPHVTVIRADDEEEAGLQQAAGGLGSSCHDLLVIGSVRRPECTWPVPPPAPTRRLQECLLLAVRMLGEKLDSTGSVSALLLDSLRGHTIHPHLTLVTGFIRSLAHELPCSVFAVVSDATLDDGLAQRADEHAARRDRSIVHYRRSLRYVEEVCPAPLPDHRLESPLTCLGPNPVIVATGGARGVTSVIVTALAERLRPRLWLLGTTEIHDVPGALLALRDDELTAARAASIRHDLKVDPDGGVGGANQRFERMLRAREIHGTLRRLSALCGQDRVRYLLCDLRDPQQVMRAAEAVYMEDDHIDLLIHGAGRIHSRVASEKSVTSFREIRDAKVAAYHHLKAAFAHPAPRQWCNFGSVSALLGGAGDTDYAAANEYLAAAARYEALSAANEWTLLWGLWTETGMVKHVAQSIARELRTNGIDNAQGATIFLNEFASPRPADPAPLYGVPADWERGVSRGAAPLTPPGTMRDLLTPIASTDGATSCWTWHADPRRDRYLAEHLIDGRPVLPAVMMLAMAAEAATRQLPGFVVAGFLNFTIKAPLYTACGEQPTAARLTSRLIAPQRVQVDLHSDLVGPHGEILLRDRWHCRVEVMASTGALSRKEQFSPSAHRIEEDPATRPDPSVQLSGVWRTNVRPSADADGADALWHPRLAADDIFAHLAIPALLIDALGRLFAYPPLPDGRRRMCVPVSVASIDIHSRENDAGLAHRHPEGLRLWYRASDDRAMATTTDGEVLLVITGLEFHTTDVLPSAVPYPGTDQACLEADTRFTHGTSQRAERPTTGAPSTAASFTASEPPVQASGRPSTFGIEHIVTAGDTSVVGPVYYTRLIDWQGECRERAGMLFAPSFSRDISGEHVVLTRSCSCEYLKEIWFGDRIAIRITVNWARLHLMKAEFSYYRIEDPEREELVARGEQLWAIVRRVDGRYEPCAWPRELAATAAALGGDTSRALIEEA